MQRLPRLRSVDHCIPRDLETIVNKAIEKEPRRRYQTAQALADDLDRFVVYRPIRARRSTAADRVFRWCWRNPSSMALTVITLLCALIIVLVTSGVFARRELVLRKLAIGNADEIARISPDGRYLSFANWTSANIAVRDLESEGERDVTDEGAWFDRPAQYGESSVWSPDGKQLAYSWYVGDTSEIRIASLDAALPLRIVYRNERARNLWTFSWCTNLILIEQRIRNGPYQLVVIDTEDETSRVVKQFDEREPTSRSRLAPDGRYLTFAQPLSKEDSRSNLYLLNVNTGATKPLTVHPADDDRPIWTPDGRWIIFVSDRRGTRGLWSARIRDGQLVGEPRCIYDSVGVIYPLGFSRKGDYFFGRWIESTDLYQAALDFGSAAVTSPPTKIQTRFDGATPAGAWSPDGQQLAYLFRGRFDDGDTSINVRSPDGGERKMVLSSPFQRLHFPVVRWTSDGTALLIRGRDSGRDPIFFRVDANNGQVDRLARTGLPEAHPGADPSEHKGMLYYVTHGVNGAAIMCTDLETQQHTQLYRARPDEEFSMSRLSPDGKLLAYVAAPGTLRVLSVDADTPRTLYTVPKDERISIQTLAWSRDARFVLFGSQTLDRSADGTASVTLWQISANGGTPKAIGIVMTGLKNLGVHPDNERILFSATDQNAGGELWVLENLLVKLDAEED